MTKTQITYVVMILAFSLGLWAILRAGSHLRAAPDVAGQWALTSERPDPNLPERLTLVQSGRFVNAVATRADGSTVQLRGTLEQSGNSGVDLLLKAAKDQSNFTAAYDPPSQTLAGTAEGAGRWHARRVPKDSPR